MGKLRDEPRVREIVLVHDRERAYGARAVAVLEGLVRASRLTEQFAERGPDPDFPDFTAKEVAAICNPCPLRPETIFASLGRRLVEDPSAILDALRVVVGDLEASEEEGCARCLAGTLEDLRILLSELRGIVA